MTAREALSCLAVSLLATAGHAAGPAAAAEPACPSGLVVWETIGAAADGSEWTARILEIRESLAFLRLLTIRMARRDLPPEQARWFAAPDVLEPVAFFVASRDDTGDVPDSFCRQLDATGLRTLSDRTRSRCYIKNNVAITPIASTAVAGAGAGMRIATPMGLVEPNCYAEDLLPMLEPRLPPAIPADAESRARLLDRGRQVLAGLVRERAPLVTGPAAVPSARDVLSRLAAIDPAQVPPSLPSAFSLEISVAPRDVAEALALERLLGPQNADLEVALDWLGDHPSPPAATLLRVRLSRAVSADDGKIVSMCLRALLVADRQAARLEAVELLPSRTSARAALGVFALSDSKLRKDLESLDPTDAEALRAAASRVLALLETADQDDAVRAAAARAARKP